MGFTTRCLIKKSTPELIDKLRGLGYIIMKSTDGSNYLMTTFGCVVGMEIICPFQVCTHTSPIDCGTNESLFLAIAALRDDTNENQWFICDVNHWDRSDNGEATVYAEIGEWIFCKSNDDDCARDNHYHKATVEELIEHFNKS